MVALAGNMFNYVKQVNHQRELILVEGKSAMIDLVAHAEMVSILKAREAHYNIIEENIRIYGKIRRK